MDTLARGISLFEPVTLALACGPLAAYLISLAGMHIVSRPVMVTGLRDATALAVGLAGLVAVGPMELFMPVTAADHFGPRVWLLLFGLYGLTVLLIVLLMRPRLVIYNLDAEQLRPLLNATLQQLEEEPRWAGECLSLPRLGIQMYLEGSGATLRHVELVAAGYRQNYDGWKRFERALRAQLSQSRVRPNPWAGCFLGAAFFLILLMAAGILQDPAGAFAAFREKFGW